MRRALAAHCTIALLTIGGCTFDLTEVPEVVPDVEAPRVTIELRTTRDSATTLTAGLYPGTTSDGVMRDLVDDSIRIDGVSHAPIEQRPDGWLVYGVPALAAAASHVVVEPPRVPGLSPPFPTVALEVMRIVTPDTLIVMRGGLLEIGVTGIGEGAQHPYSNWTVGISSEEGPVTVTLHVNGAPPPVIAVSTGSLPPELTRGVVHVRVDSGRNTIAPDEEYSMFTRSSAYARLPFRIVTP